MNEDPWDPQRWNGRFLLGGFGLAWAALAVLALLISGYSYLGFLVLAVGIALAYFGFAGLPEGIRSPHSIRRDISPDTAEAVTKQGSPADMIDEQREGVLELVVRAGDVERRFPLRDGMAIGRAAHNDVALIDEYLICREHGRIVRSRGAWGLKLDSEGIICLSPDNSPMPLGASTLALRQRLAVDDTPKPDFRKRDAEHSVSMGEIELNPFSPRFREQETFWYALAALFLTATIILLFWLNFKPLSLIEHPLRNAPKAFIWMVVVGALGIAPRVFPLALLLPIRVVSSILRDVRERPHPKEGHPIRGWSSCRIFEAGVLGIAVGGAGLSAVLSPYSSFNQRDRVVVSADGSGDCSTVRQGIQLCRDGGVVVISPGIYEEQVVLERPLTVRGIGPAEGTVIQFKGRPALVLSGNGAVEHLSFKRIGSVGSTDQQLLTSTDQRLFTDAAVLITSGDPAITQCVLESSDGSGVAVWGRTTAPTLVDCEFAQTCKAGISFVAGAGGDVRGCDIAATEVGVIIFGVGTSPEVVGCVMERADFGILIDGGAAGTLRDCTVRGCNIGIRVKGSHTAPTVMRMLIESADTGSGGGLEIGQGASGTYDAVKVTGGGFGVAIFGTGTDPVLLHCVANGAAAGDFGLITYDGAGGICRNCRFEGYRSGVYANGEETQTIFTECEMIGNITYGVSVDNVGAKLKVEQCDLRGNGLGAWSPMSGATPTRSGNNG